MSTPRQRVRVAMDLGIPDRVPLMCQFSIGHMLLQLNASPAEFWHDGDVFADGLIRLREIYDFDGILVSLHGHDPGWTTGIQSRRKLPDGEEIVWKDGRRVLYLFYDLPQPMSEEKQGFSLAELSIDSLPAILDYIPVSQGLKFKIDPEHRFDIFRRVREKIGPEYSLHGEITSPFDYFLDLFGHQEGLLGLLNEPEKSKEILAHFAGLIKHLALEMCEEDVDAIKVSSPFAGAGFISPKFYREFVLPFESEIARAVRNRGVHIYTHTCGAVSDRLELMFDAGVSGIECLDPPPLGNVELEDAKRRTRGRGFIKGNIDSVDTLLHGTEVAILEDARRRIEVGKEGGGFILSTACSVAPYVEREKLILLREAVERWG
ncbi:MAG: uroporphyrinogen decarboxylase family protein [Ignavibacteria bacterium]|nr:uroporphyrinogen decarboxylase family protein [Ignavibacteria bacterium]